MAVKGITHKIIEVKSKDNDFFEKAVFYLKPGVKEWGLNDEINSFLKDYPSFSGEKEKKRKKILTGICIILWSLFVSFMTLLVIFLMID